MYFGYKYKILKMRKEQPTAGEQFSAEWHMKSLPKVTI